MDDFENMAEFSPFTWQPVYSDGSHGEIMDFNMAIEGQSHLSSSRGVLETIVEETSDDEHENGGLYGNGAKWSGSDSFSSGSSETGSVVHVEIQNDHDNQDTMSERDFICPPKRRKQEIEQPKLDFIPTSSLFSQLLNVPNAAVHSENGLFDGYFMKPSDLRYRFDELGVELFSDSDRLSYTSLSRSSSLIQFESLERQLQSDSQISGSSPSIYSYEGVQQQQQQPQSHQESQLAINLPTIKITNPVSVPHQQQQQQQQFKNSDSEPYSSSSSSSDDSEILATVKANPDSSLSSNSSSSCSGGNSMVKQSATSGNSPQNDNNDSKKSFRAKNSVDSLSEDSGYCDRDIRSLPAALPSGHCDLEDEDGSAVEVKSLLPRVRSHSDTDDYGIDGDDDICYRSMESLSRRRLKTRKIEDAHTAQPPRELKIAAPSTNERRPMAGKNKSSASRERAFLSISSPELRASDTSRERQRTSEQFTVRSLPEHLHLVTAGEEQQQASDTVASKNFNLFDFGRGARSSGGGGGSERKKVVDISASCANLTLLNYSDDCCYDSHRLLPISSRRVKSMSGGSGSGRFPYEAEEEEDEEDYIASYRSKELTSLLEEISAHFNKNLSILNDREASYEPATDVRDSAGVSGAGKKSSPPPKAPPRTRTQIKTSPNHNHNSKTFDRDPTNLATTYAQSLEKCNFNVDEPVNVYSSRQNVFLETDEPMKEEDEGEERPVKRNFVSSTPNLNFFDFEMRHVQHYSSIDNAGALGSDSDHLSPSFQTCTSMKEIPASHSRASSTGILASHSAGGSRSGLSVSFCPIVSEISWQVSNEEEDEEDDGDFSDDVAMESSYSGARSDSLINYYHEEDAHDDDDDDDEEDFDDFRAVGTSTVVAAPIQTQQQQPTQGEASDDRRARNIETFTEQASNIEALNDRLRSIETSVEPAVESVSHKMLVESQTPSEKFIAVESTTTVPPNYGSLRPSSEKTTAKGGGKQKKSLLSRISSGFRFSFRGKKNKKLVSDGVVHYPVESNNNNNTNNGGKEQQQQQSQPQAQSSEKLAQELHEKLHNAEAEAVALPQPPQPPQPAARQSRPPKPARESPPKQQQQQQVMGKPPLPKLPPRIVGTTTKRASAHPPRASSTPREYDNGEFHHPQQRDGMIGDGLKQQYYSERARTMDGAHKIGLIETNLDTDETVINGKTQSLMELGIGQGGGGSGNRAGLVNRIAGMGGVKVMNQSVHGETTSAGNERWRPHKSMEFLLDKENHQRVLPPENELQKARESNLTLSEHQLRVQASLQKLNIPDWYKQYSAGHNTSTYVKNPDVTGILRKRNSDIGRWQGLSSKTTSLSSLGSNRSDRSPVMLSPSAHSHTGGQTGFSRWSTSHLNSSQTSPSVSARSSFVRNTAYASTMSGQSNVSSVSQASDIRNSFRKPYLGWRSQEKLNQPRTAHERLASSLMSQKQQQQPIATPEIQSSIKEVTSAIVHYVNDQTNRGSRSRSVSPSTRCWLESSFVGTKPLESPQTPAVESQFGATASSTHKTVNIGPMSVAATNYDTIRLNGIGGADAQTSSTFVPSYYHPSVRSSVTSLEDDVILSLLGLPSELHKSSSEDLANQANCRGLSTFSTFKPSPSKQHTQQQQQQQQQSKQSLCVEQSHSRRHSEGDCQKKLLEHHSQDYEDERSDEIGPLAPRAPSASTSTSPAPNFRRISLDSAEAKRGDLFRCRYPKCEVAASPAAAKRSFKSCHNCSHLYCSRECRRNHWERGHRRACLHSRVSALCRQVLATCKDDADTLRHLSLLARRGFLAQGRGVVRLLFRSPENADLFIKQGFQCLGEVSFVRWPELLPQEMGPELYSELLKLSNEYKPEGKMLIYVAICVVSEAPGSSTSAPVKWERQLVSRCAKLKLCKSILADRSLFMSGAGGMGSGGGALKHDPGTDVLILSFNTGDKVTQKSREIILANVTHILGEKGISLRKHHPEVHQRLSNYVEGLTERFLPVTIHPRDSATGKAFVCIIFPQNGDAERIKLPAAGDDGGANDRVQTIDVGIERAELTQNSLNDDLFTEGTKF